MMSEGHRLSGLEMGEARHQDVGVGLGPGEQDPHQPLQLIVSAVAGVADPQAEVHRHLVVAGAGGVQAASGRADQLAQTSLHIHVDILELLPEGEGPSPDLGGDRIEAALDGRFVIA
jgi:hypothetical protein